MTSKRGLRTLILAMGLLAVTAGPALADTIQVTTAADSGPGSLREAIIQAEGNAVADEITFAADYTIMLASTLPDISTEITIRGNGWGRTIIDGGMTGGVGVRAFRVTTGFLTLDAVTVTNCESSAVVSWADGQLLVTNSRLSQSRAVYGGAISASGSVTVESTSFIGNQSNGGGAIYFDGATLDVSGSTFTGNTATGASTYIGCGGAIEGRGVGTTLIFTDCSFTGNSAEQRGGAIYLDANASATLSFVTFSGNSGTAVDSGIYLGSPGTSADITHSIVTDSCADDGSGATLTSLGYNLDIADTCGFNTLINDLINTDPLLGPLQANGGPTETMALPMSSPAVDAGAVSSGAVTADQRGLSRLEDGDGDGAARCDIGAYELQGTLFADGFESGDTTEWTITGF